MTPIQCQGHHDNPTDLKITPVNKVLFRVNSDNNSFITKNKIPITPILTIDVKDSTVGQPQDVLPEISNPQTNSEPLPTEVFDVETVIAQSDCLISNFEEPNTTSSHGNDHLCEHSLGSPHSETETTSPSLPASTDINDISSTTLVESSDNEIVNAKATPASTLLPDESINNTTDATKRPKRRRVTKKTTAEVTECADEEELDEIKNSKVVISLPAEVATRIMLLQTKATNVISELEDEIR
jgi:hypothetical protein